MNKYVKYIILCFLALGSSLDGMYRVGPACFARKNYTLMNQRSSMSLFKAYYNYNALRFKYTDYLAVYNNNIKRAGSKEVANQRGFSYNVNGSIPEWAQSNSKAKAPASFTIYSLVPLPYIYVFNERKNNEIKVNYVSSNQEYDTPVLDSSEEDVYIEDKLPIEVYFNRLDSHVKTTLIEVIKNFACGLWPKKYSYSLFSKDIVTILNTIPQEVKAHYEHIIIDLALSKEQKKSSSMKVEQAFSSNSMNQIVQLSTYITFSVNSVNAKDASGNNSEQAQEYCPYRALGLDKSATFNEIKYQYFKLRLHYENDPQKLAAINKAYQQIKQNITYIGK